jgi:hypothetical protein
MNKKLFITLLANLIVMYSIGQTIPSTVPTNGLIGWWPLDGNANDISGNNYNGTNSGAVANSNRYGVPNSCLYFDQDYVEVLGIPFNLQNDFTFSYWQKLNTYNDTRVIVDVNQNTICNGTPHIWQYLDSIRLGMCGTATNSKSLGGQSTLKNIWINYTFTNQGGTTIMYKNGVQLFSLSNIWPSTTSIQFTLANGGNSSWIHGQPSDIYLDDVGLWNRVLTESEITGLLSTNVSVSNVNKNNGIKIFPIPAREYIYIANQGQQKEYNYRIFDYVGKLVKSGLIKSNDKINIENLSSGHYILKLENEQITGFKIIKE